MLKNNEESLLSDWNTTSNKLHLPLPTDSEYGVDWLTLGFYIDPDSLDLYSSVWTIKGWKKKPEPDEVYDVYYLKTPFLNTIVDVKVNVNDWRCWVSFNPSTAVYGKTRTLIKPEDCSRVVGALLNALSAYLMPIFDHVDDQGTIHREPLWSQQVKVSRIDCARNLFISDPYRFKKAISAATPRNKKTKYTYENGAKGWGVVNQTKESGKDQVYDKDVELKFDKEGEYMSQEGGTWFRFETHLMKKRLPKFGITHLSHVTETAVWTAILERWTACRWDVTFSEPGTIAKAVSHLTVTEKKGILSYLDMHFLGFGYELSGAAERKYGKLAKDLGFTVGEPVTDQGLANQKVDITLGEVVDLPT